MHVGQAILPAAFQAAVSGHARVFTPEERRLKAGGSQDWLLHDAASRKRAITGAGSVAASSGRRIDNPPDPEGTPANLAASPCGPPKVMKTRGRLARGPAADQGVRPTLEGFSTVLGQETDFA